MLKTLFSVFGTVEQAYIIPDKETGQSKGYGFVVMSSDAEAEAAIKALDGKKCGDFTVKVQEKHSFLSIKELPCFPTGSDLSRSTACSTPTTFSF